MRIIKMKKMIILLLFLSINPAFADLNGTVIEDGHGSLFVRLRACDGHEYTGYADDPGYGILDVKVQDDDGDVYEGYAANNGNGKYNLELENEVTDRTINGVADPN
jgi:hypothetical protein